jgi:hypothetical protein
VRIREGAEEHRWQLEPREPAVRPVEHVDPNLLLDHVDLVAQVLLGQPGSAHAVRLKEQRSFQRIARQHLVVVGVVQVRRAVEGAAGALDVTEVGELLQALRALEHEVLEEVGEAGAPLWLRADPDVVDDRDSDHRRRSVGGQDNP